MRKQMMAGIDLHGNEVMIGIVDQDGRRLQHKKLPCDLEKIDGYLAPLKARLKSMAIEEAKTLYEHPANCPIAKLQKEHMEKLDQSIGLIEKGVLASAQELPFYRHLLSLPGIGPHF